MSYRCICSLCLVLFSTLAMAQPAEMDAPRLPPPVEHVLRELAVSPEVREQVRQSLLRQRQERQDADAQMRARHRTELLSLLSSDQLLALDAARPPPPGDGHRSRPAQR